LELVLRTLKVELSNVNFSSAFNSPVVPVAVVTLLLALFNISATPEVPELPDVPELPEVPELPAVPDPPGRL